MYFFPAKWVNKGKILALGSIHELTERLWKALPVEMEFLSAPSEAVTRSIREIEGVTVESIREHTLTLRISQKQIIPSVIGAAVRNGGEIFRVTPRDYSLEEIYFAVQEQGGITS